MKVFHLLSAEYGLENIKKSRIKIARYSDANDPFELLAGNLGDKTIRNAVNALKANFHKTKGFISFSPNWRNPVLWSHYADKHKGIALGFQILDKHAAKIQYRNSRIPVTFKNNNPKLGLTPDYAKKIIHTKYKHWAYEQEIRQHIKLDENVEENGLYFMPFSDELRLIEVILGHESSISIGDLKKNLRDYIPKVKIIKGRLAFTSFTVTIDKRYSS